MHSRKRFDNHKLPYCKKCNALQICCKIGEPLNLHENVIVLMKCLHLILGREAQSLYKPSVEKFQSSALSRLLWLL